MRRNAPLRRLQSLNVFVDELLRQLAGCPQQVVRDVGLERIREVVRREDDHLRAEEAWTSEASLFPATAALSASYATETPAAPEGPKDWRVRQVFPHDGVAAQAAGARGGFRSECQAVAPVL